MAKRNTRADEVRSRARNVTRNLTTKTQPPAKPKRGSTQRGTVPKRAGDIASNVRSTGGTKRSPTSTGSSSVANSNSAAANRVRAEGTKRRLRANTSAARTATRKANAAQAARKAALKGAASAVAKRAGAAGAVYSGAKALLDLQRKGAAGKPKSPTSGPRKRRMKPPVRTMQARRAKK